MCLAIPGKVIDYTEADQSLALIDVGGVRRRVDMRLLAADDLPRTGDWVLVYVGFAGVLTSASGPWSFTGWRVRTSLGSHFDWILKK